MPAANNKSDSRTVTVDSRSGRARIMAYVQFTGSEGGIRRESVNVLHFHLIGARWLIHSFASVEGMDMLALDGI